MFINIRKYICALRSTQPRLQSTIYKHWENTRWPITARLEGVFHPDRVKEAELQLGYYAITVVTAALHQSERAAKKAGDSYTLKSSEAAHSHFWPLDVFLQRQVRKKGGSRILILGGIQRLWLHNALLQHNDKGCPYMVPGKQKSRAQIQIFTD